MKEKVYSSEKLTNYARQLRQSSTNAEKLLWKRIRNRQMFGLKFRRQVPIGNYIVDFYCESINLIIEIDGSSHDDKKFDYDKKREEYLKSLNYQVLRFTEFEVFTRIDDTLQTLLNHIGCSAPHPNPLLQER